MPSYTFPQLADDTVLQAFDASISQTCTATATMLAYLAEVDHRKLYVRAAYPSMHQYCVHEKHMSEHTANKRIRVARIAREFPAIFPALSDGRLRLSAVLLLGPHLTAGTADELLAAAAHRTNAEIELLLAARFPRPDVPALVQACAGDELAVRRVVPSDAPNVPLETEPLSGPAAPRAKLAPLSPGRFALQFTVDQATHDKLRYAQALLGHALPSGDVVKVFERALDALVNQLEKQKFAKCARSRPRRGTPKGRHIPAEVKRGVWGRDGGQCTFRSEIGQRCEARSGLEFDHIEPVARGGESTVGNLRLRCRAHNQHAAECTFGVGFMDGKRRRARERAAQEKANVEARVRAREGARAQDEAVREKDVIPWLRELGYNLARARTGAAACAHIPDAPLEERLKVALRALAPHCVRWTPQVASGPA